jgi:protein subunit release factor B
MSREKLFSVTLDDCEVQTFRSGGKGGQNQNKRDTGVRIIHHPSGARGESREERSQLQNKKTAFKKMADSPAFKFWVSQMTGRIKTEAQLIKEIDESVAKGDVRTEVKRDGKWHVIQDEDLEQAQ